MIKLNAENFADTIMANPKILVFFYREKGCSFCGKMKPIVAEYEKTNVVGWYELGPQPDSVTEGLVKNFPTFVAYENGKMVGSQEGAMPLEKLALTFTPEKLPAKQVPIVKAKLLELLTEEANLIDSIVPLKAHLLQVQAEIKARRDLANGL